MTSSPVDAAVPSPPALVLVVDDEESARELVSALLRRHGFAVATASGGAEGLRLAAQMRPAVIVLDVMMPEVDGWAVLQRLKTDPDLAAIPVVMNTAVAEPSQGYVLGAAAYLTKPLDAQELVQAVAQQVRLARRGPVLIIGADEGTVDITAAALQRRGWPVAEATRARDALDAIARQRPCAILMDPDLPDHDGYLLLEELHRHPVWRDLPVVTVVGPVTTPDQERILARCSDAVLRQGAHTLDELLDRLHTLVPADDTDR
jgi:CheY-like chemotaxis protein